MFLAIGTWGSLPGQVTYPTCICSIDLGTNAVYMPACNHCNIHFCLQDCCRRVGDLHHVSWILLRHPRGMLYAIGVSCTLTGWHVCVNKVILMRLEGGNTKHGCFRGRWRKWCQQHRPQTYESGKLLWLLQNYRWQISKQFCNSTLKWLVLCCYWNPPNLWGSMFVRVINPEGQSKLSVVQVDEPYLEWFSLSIFTFQARHILLVDDVLIQKLFVLFSLPGCNWYTPHGYASFVFTIKTYPRCFHE